MKSDDPVILEYVTSVAKRLTQLFSGRIQIIRNEAVPDLISLTEHPDADIKNNCIEAICNLLEEPLHIEFFTSSECVRSIYNLVDSEYSAIQIQALAALEKLTRRSVGVSALKAVEIIPNFQYVSPVRFSLHSNLYHFESCFLRSRNWKIGNSVTFIELASEFYST